MGNSTTTIAISTDKKNYYTSDLITGTVFLIISSGDDEQQQQQQHGVNINAIHVKLSGKEISIINKDNTSEMLNREFFGVQHSLSAAPTINNNDNNNDGNNNDNDRRRRRQCQCCISLTAGYYEFPFQIRLPAGLPSSMCCKNDEFTTSSDDTISKCEIKYEIKASLLLGRHQPSSSSSSSTMHGQRQRQHESTITIQDESSCTIIVSSLPQHMRSSSNTPTTNSNSHCDNTTSPPITHPPPIHQITSPFPCPFLSFCHKSLLTIQASIDRDTLHPGETLSLRYAYRNPSSITDRFVTGVAIELFEESYWKTNTKQICHARVMERVFISKEEHDVTDDERGRRWVVPRNETNVILVVPRKARYSYEGMLLGVRHVVAVTIKTTLWMMEPRLEMVVGILPPLPAMQEEEERRLSSVWEVHDAIVVSSSTSLSSSGGQTTTTTSSSSLNDLRASTTTTTARLTESSVVPRTRQSLSLLPSHYWSLLARRAAEPAVEIPMAYAIDDGRDSNVVSSSTRAATASTEPICVSVISSSSRYGAV